MAEKLHMTKSSPFYTRFREHYRDYTHGHTKSKFAEHLLQHHHSIGPIHTVMEPIYFTTKGRLMNTTEKFHTYQETKQNNQINDKHKIDPVIFKILVHTNSDQDHQPPPPY
jgi:hypothetical protein